MGSPWNGSWDASWGTQSLPTCLLVIRWSEKDEESPDEENHLASAMYFALAGFRSMIGTMWAVLDGAHTNKIMFKFYNNMLDEFGRLNHTRAALALQKTMNSLIGIIPLNQQILCAHIGA